MEKFSRKLVSNIRIGELYFFRVTHLRKFKAVKKGKSDLWRGEGATRLLQVTPIKETMQSDNYVGDDL